MLLTFGRNKTDFLLICLTSLAASGLTLFSSFGLGTLLMPVFALFFSVEVAVAQTAVVHLANNLFKLELFGRKADWRTVFLFGGPASLASLLGSWTLLWLADLAPLATYTAFGNRFFLHPVKLVIAILMAGFSILELWPAFAKLAIDHKYNPAGGLLSGFFGGLSGNQGAFRSAFLIKSGLTKEAFIGTGVVIAVLVDFSRLTIYSDLLASTKVHNNLPLISAAILSAFLGAFLGSRLVRKVTIRAASHCCRHAPVNRLATGFGHHLDQSGLNQSTMAGNQAAFMSNTEEQRVMEQTSCLFTLPHAPRYQPDQSD